MAITTLHLNGNRIGFVGIRSGENIFRCRLCTKEKLDYDISTGKIFGLEQRYDFTGEPIVPEIIVKNNLGGILTQDVDYSVEISENQEPGVASLVVSGIGDYHGSISKTFIVEKTQIFMYFKWVIKSMRGTSDITQFSRLDFIDDQNNYFQYPSTTTCIRVSGRDQCPSSETAINIIDHSTNTKYCTSYGAQLPLAYVYDLQSECLDLKKYTRWQWYTANDAPERDPTSFELYVSVDGNDWILVDSKTNFNCTTSRKELAYTGNIRIQ